MENEFKELSVKIIDLKNLIEIAHNFVLQKQDDVEDIFVYSRISEIIFDEINTIYSEYETLRDIYTQNTLSALNN